MAKGFKAGAGGGTSLNFKVAGNPQPENPRENTIWVNTDVPIGAWYFTATQPENLNEGDVWFPVGTSSSVEFNALKKNGIQIYPLAAKQCVGGAWVDVEAKIYQGGEWVDWIVYLLKDGNECTRITGGWTTEGYTYGGIKFGSVTNDGEKLVTSWVDGSSYGACGTVNKVHLKPGAIYATAKKNNSGFNRMILATTKAVTSTNMVASVVIVSGSEVALSVETEGDYYIVFVGAQEVSEVRWK